MLAWKYISDGYFYNNDIMVLFPSFGRGFAQPSDKAPGSKDIKDGPSAGVAPRKWTSPGTYITSDGRIRLHKCRLPECWKCKRPEACYSCKSCKIAILCKNCLPFWERERKKHIKYNITWKGTFRDCPRCKQELKNGFRLKHPVALAYDWSHNANYNDGNFDCRLIFYHGIGTRTQLHF